jgi:hypothetical protein
MTVISRVYQLHGFKAGNGCPFEICNRLECNRLSGCHCPLDVPNFVKVEENPMAVLITGSGVINRTFIDNLEKSMDGIRSPYHCHPRVNLFLEVELMSEEELDDIASATSRGHLQYEFGIYGKPNEDTVDRWIKIIKHGKERLEAALSKHKRRKVEMFRAKDYEWTDNMYYALHKLGIQRDGSYVSHQPLWPFTLPCYSALCKRRIDNVPLSDLGYTYICPGRFPTLWIIPNNVLFAEPGSKMSNCTWLGDCLSLAMAANYSLRQVIADNFNYRSEATAKFNGYWQRKEPFALNLEADFFSRIVPGGTDTMTELLRDALHYTFLEEINRKDDVYFESISQLTKWMSQSQPTTSQLQSQLHHLEDFYCVKGYTQCEQAFAVLPPALLIFVWLCTGIFIAKDICNDRKSGPNKDIPKRFDRVFLVLTRRIQRFGLMLTLTAFMIVFQKHENRCCGGASATVRVLIKLFCYLPLILAIQFLLLASVFSGPGMMWNLIRKDTLKDFKDSHGYGFLFVLFGFTVVAIVYIIVSEIQSFFHASQMNKLREKFKDAEFEDAYNDVSGSSVSSTVFKVVGISNTTMLIGMLVMVGVMYSSSARRIMGWYASSDCSTLLMFLAFYALYFRMGYMSLIYTVSLDKWVQGHLKIKEKTGKLPDEAVNLKKETEKLIDKAINYIIKHRFLIFPIFQLIVGSFLCTYFCVYILSIAKEKDPLGFIERFLLFLPLLINTVVPYGAYWLVCWIYKKQVDNTTTTTGHYENEIPDGNGERKIEHSDEKATAPLEQTDKITEGNEVKKAATLTQDELEKIGIPEIEMSKAYVIISVMYNFALFVPSLVIKLTW